LILPLRTIFTPNYYGFAKFFSESFVAGEGNFAVASVDIAASTKYLAASSNCVAATQKLVPAMG